MILVLHSRSASRFAPVAVLFEPKVAVHHIDIRSAIVFMGVSEAAGIEMITRPSSCGGSTTTPSTKVVASSQASQSHLPRYTLTLGRGLGESRAL